MNEVASDAVQSDRARSGAGSCSGELLGADARQRRRRLWRYRHQPALRFPRGRDGGRRIGGPITREIVLGVLSLILWALILVVTVKYVLILLRADNNGEGGTLSLMALALRALGRRAPFVMMLGIVGAAMFFGDSRDHAGDLGALRGRRLKLVTPGFEHFVVPLTVVILVGLFAVQRRGTAKVAAFFGPVMVIWFLADRGRRAAAHHRRSRRVRWRSIPIMR